MSHSMLTTAIKTSFVKTNILVNILHVFLISSNLLEHLDWTSVKH